MTKWLDKPNGDVMKRKRYDYVAAIDRAHVSYTNETGPKVQRILRKLVREALVRGVQCDINQANGAAIIARIAKELVP